MSETELPSTIADFLELYKGCAVKLGIRGLNTSASPINFGDCTILDVTDKEVLVVVAKSGSYDKKGDLTMRWGVVQSLLKRPDGSTLISFLKADVDTIAYQNVKITR
jgi:hypothetical protein